MYGPITEGLSGPCKQTATHRTRDKHETRMVGKGYNTTASSIDIFVETALGIINAERLIKVLYIFIGLGIWTGRLALINESLTGLRW